MFDRLFYLKFAALVGLCLVTGCASTDHRSSQAAPRENAPDLDVKIVEETWPNGALKSRKHMLINPDGVSVEHGLITLWYESGLKEYEANYDRGKLDGLETAWHANGQKRAEQTYANGLREGRRRSWDEKGRLRSEEFYLNDRPHGEWTIWKGDGAVKWRARFENGKPVPES